MPKHTLSIKCSSVSSSKFSLAMIISVLCLSLSHKTLAKPTFEQWQQFNVTTLNTYILPRYKSLAEESNLLAEASSKLCRETSAENLILNIQHFHRSFDAWQSIQNINFGPIETGMRGFSLQFWPDKKNHVGKRLQALLEQKNQQVLSDESFAKLPVSVKGFPAIERLLFNDEALSLFQDQNFRCQLLSKISHDIALKAQALHTEWQEDMAPQFQNPTQVDGYFEDEIDAATSLLKTLVEPIEVIGDLKLKRPMGSTLGKAKYKRLESWRSARSARNIRLNTESLNALYQGLKSLLPHSGIEAIDSLFVQALQQTGTRLNTPMKDSINTPKGYANMTQLVQTLSRLHAQLESSVGKLGIHLGFNSRDGD